MEDQLDILRHGFVPADVSLGITGLQLRSLQFSLLSLASNPMTDTSSLFGHKPRARSAEQVAADGPRARAMGGMGGGKLFAR